MGEIRYRGWIAGASRERFEALGIVITGDDEHGYFLCEMDAETLATINPMWGAWLWGLRAVTVEVS